MSDEQKPKPELTPLQEACLAMRETTHGKLFTDYLEAVLDETLPDNFESGALHGHNGRRNFAATLLRLWKDPDVRRREFTGATGAGPTGPADGGSNRRRGSQRRVDIGFKPIGGPT